MPLIRPVAPSIPNQPVSLIFHLASCHQPLQPGAIGAGQRFSGLPMPLVRVDTADDDVVPQHCRSRNIGYPSRIPGCAAANRVRHTMPSHESVTHVSERCNPCPRTKHPLYEEQGVHAGRSILFLSTSHEGSDQERSLNLLPDHFILVYTLFHKISLLDAITAMRSVQESTNDFSPSS